jgi:hypothetical protein
MEYLNRDMQIWGVKMGDKKDFSLSKTSKSEKGGYS